MTFRELCVLLNTQLISVGMGPLRPEYDCGEQTGWANVRFRPVTLDFDRELYLILKTFFMELFVTETQNECSCDLPFLVISNKGAPTDLKEDSEIDIDFWIMGSVVDKITKLALDRGWVPDSDCCLREQDVRRRRRTMSLAMSVDFYEGMAERHGLTVMPESFLHQLIVWRDRNLSHRGHSAEPLSDVVKLIEREIIKNWTARSQRQKLRAMLRLGQLAQRGETTLASGDTREDDTVIASMVGKQLAPTAEADAAPLRHSKLFFGGGATAAISTPGSSGERCRPGTA